VRLFIGCETGPVVAAAAAALIDELRERAARLAPHARLTWIPRERLHLTVRFIGAVDGARVPALRDALSAPLTHPPFDAAVQGLGVFPDRRPPRVIWVGLRSGASEMRAVARLVNARLAPLVGDDPEELHPHLTLARVKEPRGLRAGALFAGLETAALGVTRIAAVTLFESRQSAAGLQYVALAKTPLKAE
jgi:2'-5' RNA ligase